MLGMAGVNWSISKGNLNLNRKRLLYNQAKHMSFYSDTETTAYADPLYVK